MAAVIPAEGAEVSAARDPIDDFRGRIGMELQLDRSAVARFSEQFDFSSVSRADLPERLLQDYLTDTALFRELPKAVQIELSGGKPPVHALKTAAVPVSESRIEARVAPIAKAAASPPPRKAGLAPREIVTSTMEPPKGYEVGKTTGLILPQGAEEDVRIIRANREAAQEWRAIQEAWNRLPAERQRELVRIEKFAPEKKASLILDEGKVGVRLRADAPQELRESFTRLEMNLTSPIHRANGFEYLEIVHNRKLPSDDIREFLKDVYTVARYAGVEQQIRQPSPTQRRSAGFHYHISLPQAPAVRADPRSGLLAIQQRMNVLRLLRMMEGGWTAAVIRPDTGSNPVIYRELQGGSYVSGPPKGLMQAVSRDRLESRAHFQDPETEIREVLRYSNLPEAQALAELDTEIGRHLKPGILSQFEGEDGLRSLFGVLAEAGDGMKPESRRAAINRVSKLLKGGEKVSGQALFRLANNFPDEAGALLSEFWKPEMLHGFDENSMDRAWKRFVTHRKWSPKTVEVFLLGRKIGALLPLAKDDPRLQEAILEAITRIQADPAYAPFAKGGQLRNLAQAAEAHPWFQERASAYLAAVRRGRIPGSKEALREIIGEMESLTGETYDHLRESYRMLLEGSQSQTKADPAPAISQRRPIETPKSGGAVSGETQSWVSRCSGWFSRLVGRPLNPAK